MFIVISSFFISHSVNAVVEYLLLDSSQRVTPILSGTPALNGRAQAESPYSSEEIRQTILQSGLFPIPKTETGKGSSQEQAEAALPPLNLTKKFILRGTAYGSASVSRALIEDISSKRQILYRIGDFIPEGGEVVDVKKTGVMIRQGIRTELLPITIGEKEDAPLPPTTILPDHTKRRVLDRREVSIAFSDLSKLLGQARANPYFLEGKVAGYQLTIFNPDSFFGRIGLVSGDILKRVNGVDVRDPGQVLSLFQQVQDERLVKVDVLRQGSPVTFSYEIR